MKQSTQNRLLSDAMLAANSWHKEADAATVAADYWQSLSKRLFRSLPIFFIAGMLTATLGILLISQAFTV